MSTETIMEFDRHELSEERGAHGMGGFERLRGDQSSVAELVAVLSPHPQGLRKWSVMRAMRARAEKAGRDVPLKFENDVERAFRKLCEGDPVRGEQARANDALFYRPKDKAGEVWAVHAERARAWMRQNG